MNCEKCKNKGATVFYADDGGGRHALCASCASLLGKLGQYSSTATDDSGIRFIPDPYLTSLVSAPLFPLPIYSAKGDRKSTSAPKCTFCGTDIEHVRQSGTVGCPECYTVFGSLIFPSALSPESAYGARIPLRRRYAIERQRSVDELKRKIRLAVETENYELAAELRDRIKELDLKKQA